MSSPFWGGLFLILVENGLLNLFREEVEVRGGVRETAGSHGPSLWTPGIGR